MENVDLLFETLFFPELDDDSDLAASIYADAVINKSADGIPDPVGNFFQKAADEIAKGSAAWAWDEQVSSTATAPLEKRDFDGDRHRLWKAIVRVEKVRGADGDLWSKGYDKNDQLVDMRLIYDADAA